MNTDEIKLHYIYIITNILNNKVYIGQTLYPKKRWITHKTCKSSKLYIDRAIKKYGVNKFSFEILVNCQSQENANNMEIFFISKFDSCNKSYGYNIKYGGKVSSGWHHTKETKYKISKSETGKIVSLETKSKMSSSQKTRIRSRNEFDKMSKTKKMNLIARFNDKLCDEIVLEYNNGVSINSLSKKYKVRKFTISKIVKGISLI